MSSTATLCLFSVALCNVGLVDQNLFSNQQQQQQSPQQQGGVGGGGYLNQAANIFGGFVNAAGLGNVNFNQNNQQQQQQQQQQGQRRPQSPCPKKFTFATDGREWKGVIKLTKVNLAQDLYLDADFAITQGRNNPQRQQNNQRRGRIELLNDPETLSDDIAQGLPVLFEVHFPVQNPVPKLLAIYKNGKEICSGQVDNPAQTFRLNYHLPAEETEDRFNVNGQHIQPKPQQNPQTQQRPSQNPTLQQQQQQQRPSQNPTIQTQQSNNNFDNVNQFVDDNNVCGVPVVISQSLVVGGQPATRGEWPWLVAFYKSHEGNLQFICGGNLINARYVLTAAHCIQDKGRTSAQRPQDALLFIGKQNLIEWNEEGYEKRGALAFKVHPDWNPNAQSYDADIALIQLDKPVKYSKFIRPICLWNGAPEITKVVGQVGIVAGWGKNEEGKLNTDFPKKVNVPIVSDGTCLRAHEAFVHITSDRTFCAGGRNGEGPCQGDSGGGLVLKVGKKWFIRGIVSASLRDDDGCDENSYAIFTDIVQFKEWIRSNM